MKKTLLALMMFAGAQASAATTILDCNLIQGDLQQVVVVENGGAYVLRELTNYGRWFERALTAQEVKSQKINLYAEFGKATLTKTRSGWFFEATGSVGHDRGYADCR
ncbi:MAG: hypothetical protein KF802_02960 [Bdellovibrionaceae bacterium]|nr:hypothetical protein [Pseudobdellovibrionaceae bacterium]MBX3033869.1 hypothetical protein [Pseudobdellovibrionaceae bacterium]